MFIGYETGSSTTVLLLAIAFSNIVKFQLNFKMVLTKKCRKQINYRNTINNLSIRNNLKGCAFCTAFFIQINVERYIVHYSAQ